MLTLYIPVRIMDNVGVDEYQAYVSLITIGFCVLAGFGLLAWAALWAWEHRRQTRINSDRRTYEISFPQQMSLDMILDALRSIWGTSNTAALKPVRPISIEHYRTVEEERYFISLPGRYAEGIDAQISKALQVTLEVPDDDLIEETKWSSGVELGIRGNGPLGIKSATNSAGALTASYEQLVEKEAVVKQILIWPDRPREVVDKAKQTDVMFHTIIRFGFVTEKPRKFIKDVIRAARHVETAQSRIYTRRFVNASQRVSTRATGESVWLNATEVATFIAWPLTGGSAYKAKALAPTKAHDAEGIFLGVSNSSRAKGRRVAMPAEALRTHAWITGPSGSGKSVMLQNLAVQIMKEGMGLFLIDPKFDLVRDVLYAVPPERKNDVILFNPVDQTHPIGLNILAGGDPERITSHVVSVFHHIYSDAWGQRLAYNLKYAVLTASLAGLTLYDAKWLLLNADYRNKVMRGIKLHPDLRQFWSDYDRQTDSVRDSVINKLDDFTGSTATRHIFGQKTGLNIDEAVKQRKIILASLNGALIGQTNAAAIGMFLQEMLVNSTLRRPDEDKAKTNILMIDEYQQFAGSNTSKVDLWAEIRSFGLGIIAANQFPEQLPTDVRNSVSKNAATRISFRAGDPDDAATLAKTYGPLKSEDMLNLPRYTVAARVMSSTGMAPIVTLKTPPPPGHTGVANYIIDRSQKLYGRPAAQIDAELESRHAREDTRKKPTIG